MRACSDRRRSAVSGGMGEGWTTSGDPGARLTTMPPLLPEWLRKRACPRWEWTRPVTAIAVTPHGTAAAAHRHLGRQHTDQGGAVRLDPDAPRRNGRREWIRW